MRKRKPDFSVHLDQLGHRDGWANLPLATVVTNADGSGYLWVGNDAEGDARCFATLSGPALRKLGEAIMALAPPKKKRTRADVEA